MVMRIECKGKEISLNTRLLVLVLHVCNTVFSISKASQITINEYKTYLYFDKYRVVIWSHRNLMPLRSHDHLVVCEVISTSSWATWCSLSGHMTTSSGAERSERQWKSRVMTQAPILNRQPRPRLWSTRHLWQSHLRRSKWPRKLRWLQITKRYLYFYNSTWHSVIAMIILLCFVLVWIHLFWWYFKYNNEVPNTLKQILRHYGRLLMPGAWEVL